MNTRVTLAIILAAAACRCFAQVKSSYQYNTGMPYGTLDIRTRISSTELMPNGYKARIPPVIP